MKEVLCSVNSMPTIKTEQEPMMHKQETKNSNQTSNAKQMTMGKTNQT